MSLGAVVVLVSIGYLAAVIVQGALLVAGLPVVFRLGAEEMTAEECGDWAAIVGKWTPEVADAPSWSLRAIPDEDSPGDDRRYLLRFGSAPAVSQRSLRSRRREIRTSLLQATALVVSIFAIGLYLGWNVARPAEVNALHRLPRIERVDRPAWNASDVVYWTVTTITTTGYGDVVPATSTGRLVAMIDMILGFVGLGVLIGIVTSQIIAHKQFTTGYFAQLLDAPTDHT